LVSFFIPFSAHKKRKLGFQSNPLFFSEKLTIFLIQLIEPKCALAFKERCGNALHFSLKVHPGKKKDIDFRVG